MLRLAPPSSGRCCLNASRSYLGSSIFVDAIPRSDSPAGLDRAWGLHRSMGVALPDRRIGPPPYRGSSHQVLTCTCIYSIFGPKTALRGQPRLLYNFSYEEGTPDSGWSGGGSCAGGPLAVAVFELG